MKKKSSSIGMNRQHHAVVIRIVHGFIGRRRQVSYSASVARVNPPT
jgi:hypothetical protein